MTTETKAPDPAQLPKGWRLQTVSDGDIRMYSPTGSTWLLRANTNEDFYDFIHGFLSDLMAAIPAPEGADERTGFEAWCNRTFVVNKLSRWRDGYEDTKFAYAWEAWQARAALAAPAPQAPVPMTDAEIGDLYARWKDCDAASSLTFQSPELEHDHD